ncbi:uncharacterized protein LOC126761889 [Bactrocera neohumeralis]|uniref:uncharacterized protein LOC126761889 n=1 Tax=Bactrocera neohumeralis TaxID=98809 RepID=UPI002165F6EF|nr:uncharacterized protein LOC126761889 [Bactrocera neohumeralis]XP_050334281.1 uncharacterized protein LOC126761889 [Bactrocera neohumeralis]
MAAVVHGCGSSSPRQHHGSNISCASLAHRTQHPTSTPMYATTNKMPKYSSRSNASLSKHHHLYGVGVGSVDRGVGVCGNVGTLSNSLALTAHQSQSFNSTLPPVNYLSVGGGNGAVASAGTGGGAGGGGGGGVSLHQHSYTGGQATVGTDPCRNYWGHPSLYRGGRHHNKRKSAVELLAETKPFFIKSDTVMERLHQSSYRAATIASAGKRGRSSMDARDDLGGVSRYKPPCYSSELVDTRDTRAEHRFSVPNTSASALHQSSRSNTYQHHHHHHDHHAHMGSTARHSAPTSNSLLQNKVRMLLERGSAGETARERTAGGLGRSYRSDLLRKMEFSNKISGRGGLGGKELTSVSFSNDDDTGIRLPPPSFLSPQSFDNIYSYGAENSSGDEPLVLTENYRPISPPAEYAADSGKNESRTRYNYQRSHSHSHEMATDPNSQYNINSHKSLPDLHSQISRHSPHSEILSCCSRGNRSIKSAGESSLNRDSGGSSGHYTHRSEPCYRQQRDSIDRDMYAQASSKNCCLNTIPTPMEYRRDSGSSTQHSANSNGAGIGYASPSYLRSSIGDCAECRCKGGVRFESDDYFFNFPTPEVPEAFQDDYTPPSPSVPHYDMEETRFSNIPSFQTLQLHHQQQQSQNREQEQQQLFSTSVYSSGSLKSPKSSAAQSPGSAPSIEDISPPPIQFKRQRCIRFKSRNRISLPNAPSLPSSIAAQSVERVEPYHSEMDQHTYFFPKCFSTDTYASPGKNYVEPLTQSSSTLAVDMMNSGPKSNEREQPVSLDMPPGTDGNFEELEKFFDRLGLNDEKFHEIYSVPRRRKSADTDSECSSTVFFSDVSTVDSMRLPDSTETQPQTTQPYRPSEPPSIVERNARIIKWLCNCRKLQYV